ncbi:MAG: DUF1893 domain-containing protein [Lentimicrobiaceae bacterium]|nr:DUF1893 domain-containing protein [Lentimicrobiaceae bacterium]
MNSELIQLNKTLLSENFTIMVKKGDKVFSSVERGVKPLIHLIDNDLYFFNNSSVADKVIGKAAALLMVYGRIKEVHTIIISEPAIEVFNSYNIIFHYDKKVTNIINRNGDDICPMEKLCLNIDDPEIAYYAIKELLKELNSK